MEWHPAVQAIAKLIENETDVEGLVVSGSLVNPHRDAFSDVEIGIATKNTAQALEHAYGLRESLLKAVGQPVHTDERAWDHCKSAAALYSKRQFPPVGLEVDLTFSQLRYVQEQMPYSDYAIVFDRTGKLAAALEKLSKVRPPAEVEADLQAQMQGFPFLVRDALKAYEREEDFQLQAVLEATRKAIFVAAGARFGGQVYGAKRAQRYLTPDEHQLIDESYQHPTRDTIRRLSDLYLHYLDELKPTYAIREGVEALRGVLKDIV